MKYLSLLILVFSFGLSIVECFGATQANIKSRENLAQIETKNGQLNNESKERDKKVMERFLVFYTIDFGFSLERENDLGNVIFAKISDENVLSEFKKFFSQENLRLNVGKTLYCDCIGSHYKEHGVDFYKIQEAHLFAK
jgi:hypothetical protein